jgi:hypothetical protein
LLVNEVTTLWCHIDSAHEVSPTLLSHDKFDTYIGHVTNGVLKTALDQSYQKQFMHRRTQHLQLTEQHSNHLILI